MASEINKLPALSNVVKNTSTYTSEDVERLRELADEEIEKINKTEMSLKAKKEKIEAIQEYLTFVESKLSMSIDNEDIYANSPVVMDTVQENSEEDLVNTKQM